MSQATLSGFVEAMAQTFGIPGVAAGGGRAAGPRYGR